MARMTLALDENLVKEAQQLLGTSAKRETIQIALIEIVKQRKRDKAGQSGTRRDKAGQGGTKRQRQLPKKMLKNAKKGCPGYQSQAAGGR